MKIRPVILCGGSGTRLWSDQKHHQPKQFIDFGNWTLFGKTLERIKNSIFDYPIISTNKKYLSEIKKHLKLKELESIKSPPTNKKSKLIFLIFLIIFTKWFVLLLPR